jgi:acyl carrier protein
MVFEKIRQIICDQLELDESKVTLSSNIVEDLGADSLDLVDLIMSLEDEFDVEVPDEEIEKIKTIGDMVNYIENKKN